jgi:hypothetical protein
LEGELHSMIREERLIWVRDHRCSEGDLETCL